MEETKKLRENSLELMLDFEKRGGFIPGIAQDCNTGEILMLGYVNKEAFQKTRESGLATFFSTSRNELWTKGLTSGDTLEVQKILIDCDQDAIIYGVIPKGSGACHTKNKEGNHRRSCFYRRVTEEGKLEYVPGME